MSEATMSPERYSATAAFLHWLSAALILAQFYTGYTFHQVLERGSEARAEMLMVHKTLGVAVLAVILVRLGVRLMKPVPGFPVGHPEWEQKLTTWTHRALYGFMLIVPLSGLIGASGRGPQIELLGGISIPAVPGFSRDSAHEIGEIHVVFVYMMVALLILHILAAIRHHGDWPSEMRGRMWPSKR